jgi:Sulfatase
MSFNGSAISGPRRGLASGLAAVGLMGIALVPARLSVALGGWGHVWGRVERAAGGVVLDLSAVIGLLAPAVGVLALLLPLLWRRLRGPRWQRLGALACGVPFGFALWVATVVAQEFKRERGSFPTLFDLAEGGGNGSFWEGALGFARYQRVWLPTLGGLLLAGGLAWLARRSANTEPEAPWRGWGAGLVAGLALGAAGVLGAAAAQERLSNRFGPAALGDPLSGLVESTFDVLEHKGPSTPRQLVVDAALPDALSDEGAARLGWPAARPAVAGLPCWPHPHARPLDFAREPRTRDPRGRALLEAFAEVSRALFTPAGPPVAVFQLSLEGFRADDLHALHPSAPEALAPFVNGLYRAARAGPGGGVLAGSKVFQAGVRTAHGLGAMTCGLGTLPYNLSFIRDLHPFPVRCASDVLAAAGFAGSFFYGSDAAFDGMDIFFKEHGYPNVVSQATLDQALPRGTWDGITDLALFDQAVRQTAAALASQRAPQLAMVMSLSNHSPFTPPQDLPAEVARRLDQALARSPGRGDADDRPRLVTYAYTDAAVERFFGLLDEQGVADRSLVLLMADHSTGHAYLWADGDGETDLAKAQIPFALVIPPAFLARVADRPALQAALGRAQALLDEAPLSQNDAPALLLALLSRYPAVEALAPAARWHTLGGQVTSPWFQPGGDPRSYLLGINGVSELFALDRSGERVGSYEDSVFLKTRADRYHVTPRLIPITATLRETLSHPTACSTPPPERAESSTPPAGRSNLGPSGAPHAGRAPEAPPRR